MVGLGQDREEFISSQCQDQFLNLEQRRDHEVSVHTTHASRSQSRGGSYISHGSSRPRSRTPPSESFSCDEDRHYKRRCKSPSCKGLGNDAMSRALNQIFKSSFMRRIERGKLPRWFTQPTITVYNGITDPVEHVSHFNQRMAVHSWNEALMCKVFPHLA